MESKIYDKVYQFLKGYPLDVSVEEGMIFVQNGKETFCVMRSDNNNRVDVSYLTLYRELAEKTLKECPKIVENWYKQLRNLEGERAYNPVLKMMDDYEPVPFFKSTLNLESAIEVCSYLAAKMVVNERNVSDSN